MSGPLTVFDGAEVIQDPSAIRVYQFDWDTEHLGVGVTIATSAFEVLQVPPSGVPTLVAVDTSPLGIQAGSRSTKVKLSTPTRGVRYRVNNTIVTSEVPAQTFQKSIFVFGADE